MAATNFTSAINALVAERDRVFLVQVAADYNIPYEELQAKYLETAEKAIKVPRKYTKKPTAVTVVTEGGEVAPAKAPKEPKAPKEAKAEKQCCTAQTSKKEACKFSALKGEVFCKRHLKQSLGEPAGEKTEVPKAKVPKVKPLDPVHTHAIGTAPLDPCDLCETNGNALVEEPETFELTPAPHTGPIKEMSAAERLAAILAHTDDEEDDEEETASVPYAAHEESGDELEEEEFEDDD